MASESYRPEALVIDDTNVYCLDRAPMGAGIAILSVPRSGGSGRPLAVPDVLSYDVFAVRDGWRYTFVDDTVVEIDTVTGERRSLGTTTHAEGIAANADWVFYTDRDAAGALHLRRAPL